MTVYSTVTASDGLALAVHTRRAVDPSMPTIVAVHGYPDNHRVWDGLVDGLADRYNVVTFDVRGAGESGTPAKRSGYRLGQLVSDIGAVIDSIGVERVHLVAHDWGSIQGWAAVTDDSVRTKIASFTSVSGPHLNYAGAFLRSARGPRGVFDVLRQALASSYIGFFLCPVLPELTIWARMTTNVFAMVELLGRPRGCGRRRAASTRSLRDYLNGLNLYRANMPKPFLAPGKRLPHTTVPVQTLVARRDYFVSPPLQRFTGSIPQHGRVVPIEGGHWVVASHPDVIAQLTSEWVERTSGDRQAQGTA